MRIVVNGCEKYATGFNKLTTIDDVKFVMLSASDTTFRPELLDDYGFYESWQNDEILLDGATNICQIINYWQSLQFDEFTNVKFIIKKLSTIRPTFKRQSEQANNKYASIKRLNRSKRSTVRLFANETSNFEVSHINDVAVLKEKFISSLEQELQRLDYLNESTPKRTLASSSSNSSSSSLYSNSSSTYNDQIQAYLKHTGITLNKNNHYELETLV